MAPPRITSITRRTAPARRRTTAAPRRTYSRRARSRQSRSPSPEFNIPLLNVPGNLQDTTFNTYIKRVQKRVRPMCAMGTRAVQMLDTLLKDTMHQIVHTATLKMGKRKTLMPKMIKNGMMKVLPKRLVQDVDKHAQQVLARFTRSQKNKRGKRE